MKKIFTLFFALVATAALWAHDFSVNGIYYNTLTDKTNEVEVTYQYQWSTDNYASLTTVIIPETVTYDGTTYSVTSVGNYAFYYCSGLTSITIPNSVTSIGRYAFYDCSGLTSITIPNSVTSIGDEAFSYCSSLTSIVVEEGNTVYDSRENCNAIIETASNTLVVGCKNTTIPNSVTSIGDGAFWGCDGLTSVTIPNSVTSIGNDAFYDCSGLTSITIPNSVTSIGERAFDLCSGLTSIVVEEGNTMYDSRENCNAIIETASNTLVAGCKNTIIPNTVTSIGDYAFGWCDDLTSVTCKAVNLPEMGKGVFWYAPTTEATLYVPEVSLELYQAAEQWKEFGTILPISQVETDLENISSDNGYGVMDNGKILRNGQLIILRDGVEYNTLGQAL